MKKSQSEHIDTDILELKAEVARLQTELKLAQSLADRDPLCPVLNKRAFQRELEREISRAERYHRDLSVLFVDLDNFKQLNDTYGHEAGDHVLINVAETLTRMVRKTDIVGRLGGDEFGVILIESGSESAGLRMEEMTAILKEATSGRITASIGAASWTPGVTAAEIVASADQAMFVRKNKAKLTQSRQTGMEAIAGK